MLRVKDIHHVVYRHADLEALEAFLGDFGMVVASRDDDRVFFRGACSAPYIYIAERAETPSFGSIAFEVESRDDLLNAAALEGASEVQALDRPGGGERVILHDPAGRQVDIVHGISTVAPLPMRPALTYNTADSKQRFGDTQRPEPGPAQILRLGHIALGVQDLHANLQWYTTVLGMLPSDMVVEEQRDNPHAVFLRIDRGADWTDHHTVALFGAPRDHVHHSSFEVQDVDSQYLGNQWLTQRAWTPFWGVGRHLLGSQVFDYWYDTSGNIVEHFTDGDLYNRESRTGYVEGGSNTLYQWGPDMAIEDFLGHE